MVWWGRAGLVEPTKARMYQRVDPVVEIISYFYNDEKVEEAHVELGHSSDWSVSDVDTWKRIWSFFYECPIPFYECVFTWLKLKLPFNRFNEGMLGNMKISHSQLHPVVWALVKVY